MVGAVVADEIGGQIIERQDFAGVALENGGAGHAGDNASFFALGNGMASGGFDRAKPFGAVFAHAGHEDADRGKREFLGHGMEQHVRGRTMAVDGRTV